MRLLAFRLRNIKFYCLMSLILVSLSLGGWYGLTQIHIPLSLTLPALNTLSRTTTEILQEFPEPITMRAWVDLDHAPTVQKLLEAYRALKPDIILELMPHTLSPAEKTALGFIEPGLWIETNLGRRFVSQNTPLTEQAITQALYSIIRGNDPWVVVLQNTGPLSTEETSRFTGLVEALKQRGLNVAYWPWTNIKNIPRNTGLVMAFDFPQPFTATLQASFSELINNHTSVLLAFSPNALPPQALLQSLGLTYGLENTASSALAIQTAIWQYPFSESQGEVAVFSAKKAPVLQVTPDNDWIATPVLTVYPPEDLQAKVLGISLSRLNPPSRVMVFSDNHWLDNKGRHFEHHARFANRLVEWLLFDDLLLTLERDLAPDQTLTFLPWHDWMIRIGNPILLPLTILWIGFNYLYFRKRRSAKTWERIERLS